MLRAHKKTTTFIILWIMTMSRRPKLICYFKKISCKCCCCNRGRCCCCRHWVHATCTRCGACMRVHRYLLFSSYFALCFIRSQTMRFFHSKMRERALRVLKNDKTLEFSGSLFTPLPSWCLHSSRRLLLVSNSVPAKRCLSPVQLTRLHLNRSLNPIADEKMN